MQERSLLLVEDEIEAREFLANIIQRRGVKVFGVGTGEEAIEVYKENRPGCVFLDLRLPDMEGIAVLEKLKEINPEVKVYFITGVDDNMMKEKAIALGAQGYLSKPLDLEEIERIIENL